MALVVSLAACGGDDKPSAGAATTRIATATFPSLGCDVLPFCLPEWIRETLDACPESELSPKAIEARRQLEQLLPRVRTGEPAPGHEADHEAAAKAWEVVNEECLS